MNDPWAIIRERWQYPVDVDYIESGGLIAEARQVLADVDMLLVVARRYASHDDICDHADPCSCGFDAALAPHLKGGSDE